MKRMILCAEAKRIDMVAFLEELGFTPQKIRGNDYWYLSPLRVEKIPSFKINRKKNVWYDHGSGKGGSLIDFGIQFYGCSLKEFLKKLTGQKEINFSFHQPLSTPQLTDESEEKKLIIVSEKSVEDPRLCTYLKQRDIDLDLARTYLKEVSFELNGKNYKALGFQNSSGGFELRNEFFKGSSSPKDYTFIDHQAKEIAVFEGCFSFLSYLSLDAKSNQLNRLDLPKEHTNFLVLNSLAFLGKSRLVTETHDRIHLYLDRDTAGVKATEQALEWSEKYKDKSHLYHRHKDLNEYLVHLPNTSKEHHLKRGRHF
ncbi:MAG TPA: CHC2 zinc finger domain-containing protein [Flavisolibacter sp.]|nr:CHC2 zinc finger domain-containing protein [Flavisolibacter sp.]